ncbi:MAG: nucleotidyltransferase domain-containing protein [Candidatus Pseudobacter hemicellulosilyticus]|uniref:Nucleotidyltransferase domain-containing protein n=1 Tax=Candidatus Pseudobacter hemicellulosilyticus TaxID=3121375 RepID=A0AAJ5WQL0_9BACT|nr:MAG: nucleotidyltransferase domain-containing protein [Pseudobacter sp.]
MEQKEIQDFLARMEKEKGIKMLYACETGSRAWGFPSPDSDYDIRFIYMHERDWYLRLHESKDTIECMEGDLDITGWELRKCLLLLKRSNAPLIERFQSPIVYFQEPGVVEDFGKLINSYYSPIAVFYHHYSLGSKIWEEIRDLSKFKLKSFFYLVRSLLSCNWITHDPTVLPMTIHGLFKYAEAGIPEKLQELIALKATVSEGYRHHWDYALHSWIQQCFAQLEAARNSLPVNDTNMDALNTYFLQMVNRPC